MQDRIVELENDVARLRMKIKQKDDELEFIKEKYLDKNEILQVD